MLPLRAGTMPGAANRERASLGAATQAASVAPGGARAADRTGRAPACAREIAAARIAVVACGKRISKKIAEPDHGLANCEDRCATVEWTAPADPDRNGPRRAGPRCVRGIDCAFGGHWQRCRGGCASLWRLPRCWPSRRRPGRARRPRPARRLPRAASAHRMPPPLRPSPATRPGASAGGSTRPPGCCAGATVSAPTTTSTRCSSCRRPTSPAGSCGTCASATRSSTSTCSSSASSRTA